MLHCSGHNVVGEEPSQARMLWCHKKNTATQSHMMHIELMENKARNKSETKERVKLTEKEKGK